jgi:hypothetical protein
MLQERYRELRSRLQPPFGPASSHIHLPDSLNVSAERWAGHVIARALCRFRYIAFNSLPEQERLGYVRVQLQAWSPFPHTDYSLSLGPRGAMVFAWDKALVEERSTLAGLATPIQRATPESLLLEPLREGIRLCRCIDGVEAQVFQGGELVQSRWWPAPPDATEWINFQRSCGRQPLESIPQPDADGAAPRWLGEPWIHTDLLQTLLDRPVLRIHQGLAAVAFLLALPTLWLLKSLVATDARVDALEREQQSVQSQASPLMQARDEALRGLGTLELVLAQIDKPPPLPLLSRLSRQLAGDGTVLRELEWRGVQLRVALTPAPGASRTAYVKALEAGGWLRQVHEVAAGEQGGEGGGLVLVGELAERGP